MVVTGQIFNSLTFGGVNSADYGIYITGEGTFDAPKRLVNMVSVPGRNGSVAIDQGHWDNVTVEYPAGVFGDDITDFREAISDFRNAIVSQIGYQRLTDTYHPDEYRMALYVDGLEVKPVVHNSAGEFTLKFNCKPQRWLTSGEIPVTIGEWGATKTASGEIVTIESEGGEIAKSLSVSLSPIQEGSGTPSPTNIRPISGRTEVVTHRTGKNLYSYNNLTAKTVYRATTLPIEGDENALYLAGAAGATDVPQLTVNAWAYTRSNYGIKCEADTEVTFSCVVNNYTQNCNGYIRLAYSPADDGVNPTVIARATFNDVGSQSIRLTGTVPAGNYICLVTSPASSGSTVVLNQYAEVKNIQLELGTTATDYEPYQGNAYTTALGRTVYGGTLDVVSGVLTVDRAMVDMGSLSWARITTATTGKYRFSTTSLNTIIKKPSSYMVTGELLCSIFAEVRGDAPYSNVEGVGIHTNGNVLVYSEAFANYTVEEFVTAVTGQTLVYPLATPQTYQLTPQQIDLLLGTNHVWSDGFITMRYGMNPNSLWNPTLYDAGPLLMVKGYGAIAFNGYEINLENAVYGEVELFAGTSVTNSSRTQTNHYDTAENAKVASGDSITFEASTWRVSVSTKNLTTLLRNVTVSDSDTTHFASSVSSTTTREAVISTRIINLENFAKGSAATNWSDTVTVQGEYREGHSDYVSFSIAINITVTANSRYIRFNRTYSYGTYGTILLLGGPSQSSSFGKITAQSTKSALGNPTYIDCEIGESYSIEGGEYSSMNKYIALGSDLPTLASGDNEITFDDTMTELKVKPNWWKL